MSSASNPVDLRDEPTDYQLVRRCQQGDLNAYELLVRRHHHRVFHLAYSIVRNESDANELAHEAFVRAWQNIRKFKRDAAFYTWLYRITTNLCIDHCRRRDRMPTTELPAADTSETNADAPEPPSTNPSPTDEILRAELRRQIESALHQLSPEHRAVIQLREYEGLDYATIAKVVGCSIGTVMSRLHYARKNLQRILGKVL
ncbi:MAG: sigma-70 family RNA polymerase sigma factor [Verrucomicrobiae bacterium]|nr:sigma-70 family RNA polymerase sigma factor [Verrucomicrobiae bacterium]